MRTPNKSLYRAVVALRQAEDWKFREIGEAFGFTRQRAHEIYGKADDVLTHEAKT